GPVCGCGRVGCVEAIASGRGMAAAARDDLAGCDAKTLFIRAGKGTDGKAQGVKVEKISPGVRSLAMISHGRVMIYLPVADAGRY
ncbi:ROK family protein, partial [Salmonella enterica subsp. enterica serovar Kentucky]|nr:ROK family protein [Salmonella enterica subsp. enterica serovar Kentucky]